MNTSIAPAMNGIVPAVCDAEAGPQDAGLRDRLRSVVAELRSAIHSASGDELNAAQDSLRRASALLEDLGGPRLPTPSGGLPAWQIRKVASYIDSNLENSIRNEDLAALVRLTPSHFGRAFRNSVGEPPHEYVIRRRVERAQGMMLSTSASLSDIAQDCGMADQSHLTRLFRKVVGESPRAWRRARITA